ncbi:MAG: GNAT family N-acetyltransferase [Anaerolineae bacterium]
MRIEVRPFQLADHPGLVAAVNSVCAEGMMRTPRFIPTPAWEHALAQPDCPCHLLLIAAEGPQVVGWCRLFPTDGEALELGIGVLGPYRRQGLGRALLEAALDWARGMPVVLETRTDNIPAIRLFTRFGFRIVGQEDGHWQLEYP